MFNGAQYITITKGMFPDKKLKPIPDLLVSNQLNGIEIYMNEFHPREELLFHSRLERDAIVEELSQLQVKRIHCSYWGYPTSFLTKNYFNELVERSGSISTIKKYYGDIEGNHMFERWCQEYELACQLKADAYVFHVIDYAFVDGAWDFSLTREQVLQAMIGMVQRFLLLLDQKGLIKKESPVIELENAGWGLEYGIQRKEDFGALFDQVYDPWKKLRIGWDINHLLHAIGWNETKSQIVFQLGDWEITKEMDALQSNQTDPYKFTVEWLRHNILDEKLIDKIHSFHLSDCAWKEFEYFRNGRLQGDYAVAIDQIEGNDAKSDYGVRIVLDYYDTHLPLGKGVLKSKDLLDIINTVFKKNPELALLHELKNSTDIHSDISTQVDFLSK